MARPLYFRRLKQHRNSVSRDRNRFHFHRVGIEHLEYRCLLTAVPYTWNDAQIGAGGFLDGVFFDPNNNGTMYARTDIGGLYKTTDGGNHWVPLLDFVGNSTGSSGNGTQGADMQVLAFAMDSENTQNIFALTGGGVLHSTNGGQSWTITSLSFTVNGNGSMRAAGERIAVDPYDSNIVLVGSNTANGLYESTNGGASFTQVSVFPTAAPITFILFDPYDGTAGGPTQTIFVGQQAIGTGSNIYETTNGGTTWTQVANAGGPASFYPMRATYDSTDDGNVFFTFSNQKLPEEGTTATGGGVWRYNVNTSTWSNVTPTLPSGLSTSAFVGISVDAENPGTVVVTTFDHYSSGDFIFRTTNANAASPTWVSLFGGYNTRNTSLAPYMSQFGTGIGNWAAATAIDPFNPAHIVYGTGQGLWTTLTGNSNFTLTAPNSWYFLDYGIDFTAVIGLSASPSGIPLFSGVGDINGFAHSTITSSPAQGAILPGGSIGNETGVDAAWKNPNLVAVVGTANARDAYSLNDGLTWTSFTSRPSGASGGTVAVSSTNGTSMIIVWDPSSKAPFWSTNNGSAWTASTGGMPTGGKVFADRQTPGVFYYYVSNKLWVSTNSGVSFTQMTSANLPSGGDIAVNPNVTGDLWVSASSGIWHSSDSGATWTRVGSLFSSGSRIALGAPAPGQTVPAIYIYATISGFQGYYRSDDGGVSWVQINDVNHQWGGFVTFDNGGAFGLMAADPNVYGRVYLATNGRGVIVGNPTSSLPTGWTDADINMPGNPGWSTSSETLSNGTTVNQWIVNGGGTGISGNTFTVTSLTDSNSTNPGTVFATVVTSTFNSLAVGDQVSISGATQSGYNGTFIVSSVINPTTFTYVTTPGLTPASGTITVSLNDQFNFAYTSVTGSASIAAQLTGLNNADGAAGTPQAGVMFRAGANIGDVFASLMQTTGNQLLFQYRSTTGGSVTSVSLGSVLVGSEYIELVRSGNNFTAFYSADDANWTQLGTTIAIASMPVTADVGLAATANFNSQLTSAKFANVVIRLAGDVNLDGHVDAADIDAMMQALTDTATYQSMNNLSSPDTTLILDANGDGAITNADLQFLLNRLLAGGGSISNENTPANSPNPTALFSTLIPPIETVTSPLENELPQTAITSNPPTISTFTLANNSLQSVTQPAAVFSACSMSVTSPSASFSTHNNSGLVNLLNRDYALSLSTTESNEILLASALDQVYNQFDPAESANSWQSSSLADAANEGNAAEDFWSDFLIDPKVINFAR